jgi:hypothetical protein
MQPAQCNAACVAVSVFAGGLLSVCFLRLNISLHSPFAVLGGLDSLVCPAVGERSSGCQGFRFQARLSEAGSGQATAACRWTLLAAKESCNAMAVTSMSGSFVPHCCYSSVHQPCLVRAR